MFQLRESKYLYKSLLKKTQIFKNMMMTCFCKKLLNYFVHFQQYFSYIMVTSFSGGRSLSIQREPPTMGKKLVNFITCGCESNILSSVM
jgi:hypothetical protein